MVSTVLSVPPGPTVIDVDETTLPPDAEQTAGTDPTSVDVPSGGSVSDADGYRFPTGAPTGSPTIPSTIAPVSPGPPGGVESSMPSKEPTASPAPSAGEKGSIAGTVTCLEEGNTMSPLSGVTIELLDSNLVVVASTTTNGNGEYEFTEVAPGTYFVSESNSEDCPNNVSDQDQDPDGDETDSDTTVDDLIGVTVAPGESDIGNNFVDSNAAPSASPTTSPAPSNVPSASPTSSPAPTESDKGSIAGSVTCLEEGNTMSPLSGVTIELLDSNLDVVASTTTNGNGEYEFTEVAPGTYFVSESNSEECPNNVSDQDQDPDGDETDSDTTVDDLIGVTVAPGESDIGNNFVDGNAAPSESPTTSPAPSSAPSTSPTMSPAPSTAPSKSTNASICGKVSDETLTNGLAGATITLYAGSEATAGNIVATYVTTDDGEYCFTGLSAGEYTLTEDNPASHPVDISDFDADVDGDSADSNTTTDNTIGVTLQPDEDDMGNNFVDSNLGSIAGSVTCLEEGNLMLPLSGVTIELLAINGINVLDTTFTDESGNYEFLDVEAGPYYIRETNSEECPNNVSDQDEDPDGDETDSDTTVDDLIGVTVIAGESDIGNNFVDGNAAPSAVAYH